MYFRKIKYLPFMQLFVVFLLAFKNTHWFPKDLRPLKCFHLKILYFLYILFSDQCNKLSATFIRKERLNLSIFSNLVCQKFLIFFVLIPPSFCRIWHQFRRKKNIREQQRNNKLWETLSTALHRFPSQHVTLAWGPNIPDNPHKNSDTHPFIIWCEKGSVKNIYKKQEVES